MSRITGLSFSGFVDDSSNTSHKCVQDPISDLEHIYVTYWMNRLQNLKTTIPLFVTLNPPQLPHNSTIHRTFIYQHPIFDHQSMEAQKNLWKIQGMRNTWYCGSYLSNFRNTRYFSFPGFSKDSFGLPWIDDRKWDAGR